MKLLGSFFFWEQRLEIISRTCFLFVALLSNWKIALFVFRLWLVPGQGVNQGGHRGDKSIWVPLQQVKFKHESTVVEQVYIWFSLKILVAHFMTFHGMCTEVDKCTDSLD